MSRFLAHWLTTAVALGVAAWVLPGVHVGSLPSLAVGALVLGFINALVRPILTLLTLPLTIATVGLFYLVLNAACFALAARIVPGFDVDSIGAAILGSLIVSLVSWFAHAAGDQPTSDAARR